MKTLLLRFLLASVVFFPATVMAHSLTGGELLPAQKTAVHIRAGYPDLEFKMHLPIRDGLEVVPTGTLYYAASHLGDAFSPGHMGLLMGADVKWRLYNQKRLSLAAVWEPRFLVNMNPVHGGLQLGGGLAMGYRLTNDAHVTWGVALPIYLVMGDPVLYGFPFRFDLGFELPVTPNLNVTTQIQMGPVLRVVTDESSAGPLFRVTFGASFLL